MKTITITVKGNIQKVGYRAKVGDIVDDLGIKGEIENQKDGSVKIIAQGEENNLKEFSRQVNIKNTLIRVDGVSVEPFVTDKIYTDFKKIVKPKEIGERMDEAIGHFKTLIDLTKQNVGLTKQGVDLTKQNVELTKENLEVSKQGVDLTKQNVELTKHGIEENKKGFRDLSDKQSQMLDKQDKNTEVLSGKLDKMSGKLDNIHNDLSVNLKSFHQDTITRFDIVDAKYGMIAQNMEKVFNEMKEERIETRKTMKDLIGAVLKVAEKK